MRFLIDECLPGMLFEELTRRGHDCALVRDGSEGSSDREVLARSVAEERILLSEDRDFGTLVFRERVAALGVVVIYVQDFPGTLLEIVVKVVHALERQGEALRGKLTVVEADRLRLRSFPEARPVEEQKD